MTRPARFFKTPHKLLSGAVLALGWACSASWAHPADESGWYGTVAAGATLSTPDSGTQVLEGNNRVQIRLAGTTRWGHGQLGTLAVGRQFRWGDNGEPDQGLPLRLELESVHLRLQRQSFHVAASNALIDDRLRADALFVNGLVRIGQTEHTRWWLGAGIGHANVRLPNAISPKNSCACLGPAKGTGLAYRAKLQAEYLLSDHSTVFAELGHVRLSSLNTTAATPPYTRYDRPSLTHLSAGYRQRF